MCVAGGRVAYYSLIGVGDGWRVAHARKQKVVPQGHWALTIWSPATLTAYRSPKVVTKYTAPTPTTGLPVMGPDVWKDHCGGGAGKG